MKRLVTISLIMLLLLAIEGVAIELLPSFIKLSQVYLTPHWLLLFLIIVVSFGYPNDSTIPITFAVVFGLMTDIVYTGILGVYMFMLALSVYSSQLLNRLLQANLWMLLLIAFASITVMEVGLLSIYSLIGIPTMSLNNFLLYRYIPTVVANLLFLLIIYVPSRKLLHWMKEESF